MANVVHWRTTTSALILWSSYMVTWTVVADSGPASAAVWWLLGLGLLLALANQVTPRGRGLRRTFAGHVR